MKSILKINSNKDMADVVCSATLPGLSKQKNARFADSKVGQRKAEKINIDWVYSLDYLSSLIDNGQEPYRRKKSLNFSNETDIKFSKISALTSKINRNQGVLMDVLDKLNSKFF